MTEKLSSFAARLRESIASGFDDDSFPTLALELFALQFTHNAAYRNICEARGKTLDTVRDWREIPTVPTAAFKELELTSLAPADRTTVFHSSGTTEQKPSRQFHCADSLALYEATALAGFRSHWEREVRPIILTPPAAAVPHSSLVRMFDVIRRDSSASESVFVGRLASDGVWTIDFPAALRELEAAVVSRQRTILLGTAFAYVHLLDHLAAKNISLRLPPLSIALETGGYKNRSRSMPKKELHALIRKHLGGSRVRPVCEYGMSELSSQAYDTASISDQPIKGGPWNDYRCFEFSPWARALVVSPETGREVDCHETGLLRIFDLANVASVMAIQTEDLAIRRWEHFELLGRAQLAEPRGCSLMTA